MVFSGQGARPWQNLGRGTAQFTEARHVIERDPQFGSLFVFADLAQEAIDDFALVAVGVDLDIEAAQEIGYRGSCFAVRHFAQQINQLAAAGVAGSGGLRGFGRRGFKILDIPFAATQSHIAAPASASFPYFAASD